MIKIFAALACLLSGTSALVQAMDDSDRSLLKEVPSCNGKLVRRVIDMDGFALGEMVDELPGGLKVRATRSRRSSIKSTSNAARAAKLRTYGKVLVIDQGLKKIRSNPKGALCP